MTAITTSRRNRYRFFVSAPPAGEGSAMESSPMSQTLPCPLRGATHDVTARIPSQRGGGSGFGVGPVCTPTLARGDGAETGLPVTGDPDGGRACGAGFTVP